MAHFLSKTIGTFVLAAALPLLQGQTIRPAMPGQRPNQPARPNQPVNVSPQPSQPTTPGASGTPTPAVGAPSQPAQPAMQPGPSGPPVAPVVTFRDGLLTVQALNSNLSSVVTAIRNKAGIEFEGAENANER